MQVIAAAIVPAAYGAIGIPMPDGAQDMVFAYIGYALVSLVIFRLVFFAPYLVWRTSEQELSSLKNEMGSPQFRARRAVEDRLIQARLKVLEFLGAYHFQRAVRERQPERLSDHSEFYPSLNLLVLSDENLRPLADELEGSYAMMWNVTKAEIEYGSGFDEEEEAAAERIRCRYASAKKAMLDYLFVRGADQKRP